MEGTFEYLKALGKGITVIAGSFAPDTANPPTAVKGRGFSVVRTSAGLFTVTFTGKFGDFVGFTTGLQLAAGDDKVLQIGTYVAASKALQIRVWDISAAAVADIAANADNRINFAAWFKNSTAPK